MVMAIDKACDQVEYVQLYIGDGTAQPLTTSMTIRPRDRTVDIRAKGKPWMDQRLSLSWCGPNETCLKVKFGSAFDLYFLSPTRTGNVTATDGDVFTVSDLGPMNGGEQFSIVDRRQNRAEQRIVYDPHRGVVQWEGFAHGQTAWRSPEKLTSAYGLFAKACSPAA